jgi:hypothetical protein
MSAQRIDRLAAERDRYEETLKVIATYRDHDDPMAQRLGTMAFSVLKNVDSARKTARNEPQSHV